TARRRLAIEAAHPHRVVRGRHDLRHRLGFGRVLFEVGELQLELLDDGTALRRLTESLVPQLGDQELHLLDQQRPRMHFRFGREPRRALGEQHRLQGRDVVREGGIGGVHTAD
ncbi:hypothetical protein, partial [Rhodoplanes azumiensis]